MRPDLPFGIALYSSRPLMPGMTSAALCANARVATFAARAAFSGSQNGTSSTNRCACSPEAYTSSKDFPYFESNLLMRP